MIVHPMSELGNMLDGGIHLAHYAPSYVIDDINRKMGSEQLHFGGIGDKFGQLFNTFDRLFVQPLNQAKVKIQQTKKIMLGEVQMIPILTEEDLAIVPEHMYIPLLAYAPLRELHAAGRIDGWGVSPDVVPTRDAWKDVLECGYAETDPITGKFPEYVRWKVSTDDPILEDEEKEALRESRRYMEVFLAEELSEHGAMRDPTGWCDGMLIG